MPSGNIGVSVSPTGSVGFYSSAGSASSVSKKFVPKRGGGSSSGGVRGGGRNRGGNQNQLSVEEAERRDAEERALKQAERIAQEQEAQRQQAEQERIAKGKLTGSIPVLMNVTEQQAIPKSLNLPTNLGGTIYKTFDGESYIPTPDINPGLFRTGRGTQVTNEYFLPAEFRTTAGKSPGQLQVERDIAQGVPLFLVGLNQEVASLRIAEDIVSRGTSNVQTRINKDFDRLQKEIDSGSKDIQFAQAELEDFAGKYVEEENKKSSAQFSKDIADFERLRRGSRNLFPLGTEPSGVSLGDLGKEGLKIGATATAFAIAPPEIGGAYLLASGGTKISKAFLNERATVGERIAEGGLGLIEIGIGRSIIKGRLKPGGSLNREIAELELTRSLESTKINQRDILNQIGKKFEDSTILEGGITRSKRGKDIDIAGVKIGLPEATKDIKPIKIKTRIFEGEGQGSSRFVSSVDRPAYRIAQDDVGNLFVEQGRKTTVFTGSGKLTSQFPVGENLNLITSQVKKRELFSVTKFGKETIYDIPKRKFDLTNVGAVRYENEAGFFEAGGVLKPRKSSTRLDTKAYEVNRGKGLIDAPLMKNMGGGVRFNTNIRSLVFKPKLPSEKVGETIIKSGRKSSPEYLQSLRTGIDVSVTKSIQADRALITKAVSQPKPKLASIQIGKTEQKQRQTFGQKYKQESFGVQRFRPRQMFVPLANTTPKVIDRVTHHIGQLTPQIPMMTEATKNTLKFGNPTIPTTTSTVRGIKNFNVRPNYENFIPPIVKANLNFGSGLPKFGKFKKSGIKYAPSFTALTFDIKRKKQPKLILGGYAPNELRGIVSKMTRKKSKRKLR